MAHWLMKSEPSAYSWSQLVADKTTWWSGVRNHLANKHMKAMALGDRAFFYHSNDERAIVGIMTVSGLWKLDPADADNRFGMVQVTPDHPLPHPVTLSQIKATPALEQMDLLRLSRLSVAPVRAEEWKRIEAMARHAAKHGTDRAIGAKPK